MNLKKTWNKFLVTLGYIFIGVLSSVAGFFLLRKKRINYEGKPSDIVDSLPNTNAVRKRINDFGTARRDTRGHDSSDVSPGGGVHDRSGGGRGTGVFTRWMESVKRVGVPGTRPVLRIRNSGSDKKTDETDRETKKTS